MQILIVDKKHSHRKGRLNYVSVCMYSKAQNGNKSWFKFYTDEMSSLVISNISSSLCCVCVLKVLSQFHLEGKSQ